MSHFRWLWYAEAVPADDVGRMRCAPLKYARVCLQEQRKQSFLTLAKENQSPLGLYWNPPTFVFRKSSFCASISWPVFCFVLSLRSSLITWCIRPTCVECVLRCRMCPMHILLHLYFILYILFFIHLILCLLPLCCFSIFALSMERTRLSFHCWLYSLCIVVYVTNKTWNLKTWNVIHRNAFCVRQSA